MNAIRRVVLNNGLVVLARPNRAARSVAINMVCEAGAAFDPGDKGGTAALTAELLERGAGDQDAAAIATFFDDLGVVFSAGARRDSAEIEVRLLSEHLPAVLDHLRLIVAEPTFPEEEVRRQKGQMLTSLAERDQDTAAVADMTLHATLFPADHPYHRPRLGTRESVERVGRSDLAAFHRRCYRPQATILALAGDFDATEAIERAGSVFETWSAPAPSGGGVKTSERASFPDPPPPARATVVRRAIEGKTQADLLLGFPGLRRSSPDLPAALVMNSVLGEFSLGGRLGTSIRERAGLAYYAHSYFIAGLGAGPFVARAGVAPSAVERAIGMMRGTVEGMVRRGATPAEMKDSRQALASALPRRMETNPEAASVLADAEFYGLGIDYPERLPGLVRAVTRDDVARVARAYLKPGRHTLVVAGPSLPKEKTR